MLQEGISIFRFLTSFSQGLQDELAEPRKGDHEESSFVLLDAMVFSHLGAFHVHQLWLNVQDFSGQSYRISRYECQISSVLK